MKLCETITSWFLQILKINPLNILYYFSWLSVNGSGGAGLQPQQLRDWSIASLVKVQSRDPLDIPDS